MMVFVWGIRHVLTNRNYGKMANYHWSRQRSDVKIVIEATNLVRSLANNGGLATESWFHGDVTTIFPKKANGGIPSHGCFKTTPDKLLVFWWSILRVSWREGCWYPPRIKHGNCTSPKWQFFLLGNVPLPHLTSGVGWNFNMHGWIRHQTSGYTRW